MTAARFLASLPRDPDLALAEIDGALHFDGVGASLSAEDRAAIVLRRAEIMKRRGAK